LAACGSSGGSGSSSSSSLSSQASSPAGDPSGAGQPADAATRAGIATAYKTFFSSKSDTPESSAALQHGDRFVPVLDAQGETSYAQNTSASVSSVRLVSPLVADVVFTINSGGSPVLRDTPGKAVRENGTWKVAAQTFCALLRLEGDLPDVCNDKSIVALPS
jgi:hypothetical protein